MWTHSGVCTYYSYHTCVNYTLTAINKRIVEKQRDFMNKIKPNVEKVFLCKKLTTELKRVLENKQ